MRRASRKSTPCIALASALLLAAGCATPAADIPVPDLAAAESDLAQAVEAARRRVAAEPRSAEAWGALGDRYRAHEWGAEAAACYLRAEALEPDAFVWPYLAAVSLEGKQIEAAEKHLSRALALDSAYAPALVRHGRLLAELRREDEARAQFERSLALDPDSIGAELGLGQLELSAGRFEAAAERFRRTLELQPRLGAAHHALAQALTGLGDEESAQRHAALAQGSLKFSWLDDPRAARPVEPAGSLAHSRAGVGWARRGDFEKAAEHFRRALEIDPEINRVHYNLGTALLRLGKVDEAIGPLERAAELEPGDPEVHHNLGYALLRSERLEEAAEHFRRALEINPDHVEVRYLLGTLLTRMGNNDGAAVEFEHVQRLRPAYLELQLAQAFFGTGHLREAEQRLRAAISLDPDSFDARARLGTLLMRQRRPLEAVQQLTEAVRLRPDDAEAHVALGFVLSQHNDPTLALDPFLTALRLQPEHARASFGLAQVLAELGRTEDAVERLRETLRLSPDWTEPARRLSWILATHEDERLRDGDEAVRLARGVVETGGRTPATLDLLAAALAESGRFDEAVSVTEEAISLIGQAGQGTVEQLQERLAGYRRGEPFRDRAGPPSAASGS